MALVPRDPTHLDEPKTTSALTRRHGFATPIDGDRAISLINDIGLRDKLKQDIKDDHWRDH
jgi:hypothetical protein